MLYFKGDSDCEITLPEIRFQTGRIDCTKHCNSRTEPFCTRSEEIHPNPQMNGSMIIDFLSTNTPKENSFNILSEGGISRREAVALMGVHALGRPHPVNSLFSGYEWTKVQSTFLNNEYYRNMLDYKAYIPFCGGSGRWTRMGKLVPKNIIFHSRSLNFIKTLVAPFLYDIELCILNCR